MVIRERFPCNRSPKLETTPSASADFCVNREPRTALRTYLLECGALLCGFCFQIGLAVFVWKVRFAIRVMVATPERAFCTVAFAKVSLFASRTSNHVRRDVDSVGFYRINALLKIGVKVSDECLDGHVARFDVGLFA